MSKLGKVIIGNVVIHPADLAKFLKRSHYYMSYDSHKEKITLSVNDGDGGIDLLEIRNASHENALKLAKELGLKSSDRDPEHSCFWSKYYEVLHLYHDSSGEVEWLRVEIFKLGIPCRVRKVAHGRWALHIGQYSYKPPMWSVEKVLGELAEMNFNGDHERNLDIN